MTETKLSTYKIVCKETTTEIYEIEAISKEQAMDYLLLDGTLKPVSSKLMVHPPTVKKVSKE